MTVWRLLGTRVGQLLEVAETGTWVLWDRVVLAVSPVSQALPGNVLAIISSVVNTFSTNEVPSPSVFKESSCISCSDWHGFPLVRSSVHVLRPTISLFPSPAFFSLFPQHSSRRRSSVLDEDATMRKWKYGRAPLNSYNCRDKVLHEALVMLFGIENRDIVGACEVL